LKYGYSLIITVSLLSIIFLIPVYGSVSKEVTLYPIADSYVSSSGSDNNYGGSSVLFADYIKMEYMEIISNTYLMFDLADLPQGVIIESATLTIFVTGVGSTMKVYLHFCQDVSWKELKINWRNAPRYVDKPISVILMAESTKFYSMDATEGVKQALTKGLNKLTLVVTAEPKDSPGISFDSKESIIEEYRPKLKIVYSIGPLTTTKIKTETVKTTPASAITFTQTIFHMITKTATITQTFKEQMYITVTHREKYQSLSSIVITFIVGLALGLLSIRFIPKLKRKGAQPSLEAVTPQINCPFCGGELKPLGLTGKNVCQKCGRIYE
jgi:hypothetical protein